MRMAVKKLGAPLNISLRAKGELYISREGYDRLLSPYIYIRMGYDAKTRRVMLAPTGTWKPDETWTISPQGRAYTVTCASFLTQNDIQLISDAPAQLFRCKGNASFTIPKGCIA